MWNLPQLPGYHAGDKYNANQLLFDLQNTYHIQPPTIKSSECLDIAYKAALNYHYHMESCKVATCYTQEGYQYQGVVATNDIKPNDAIFESDISNGITTAAAYNSELKHIFDKFPEYFVLDESNTWLPKETLILVFYLLHHKLLKEKSNYSWYIALLPKEVGLLFTWEDNEINELQESEMVQWGFQEKKIIGQIFDNFTQVANQFPDSLPNFTKQDLYWALECVISRTFGISDCSEMMMPLADMFNHGATLACHSYSRYNPIELSSSFYGDERLYSTLIPELKKIDVSEAKQFYEKVVESCKGIKGSFKLISKGQPYKKGEQILFCYGDDTNGNLLEYYGFCLDYNVFEFVGISAHDIQNNSKLTQILLKEFAIDGDMPLSKNAADYSIKVYYQCISRNLVKFAKLHVLHDEENKMDTLVNEVMALKQCIEIINSKIKSYPTTLEYDIKHIGNANSGHANMAIQYRIIRKKILLHQIYLIEIASEILKRRTEKAPWSDAIKQTAVEKDTDMFNVDLNRRMIENYINPIKDKGL